jgi:hypothetical protein
LQRRYGRAFPIAKFHDLVVIRSERILLHRIKAEALCNTGDSRQIDFA